MTGSKGHSLWWIGKLIAFPLACFIFSYIFWKTKQLVEQKPTKKKGKK